VPSAREPFVRFPSPLTSHATDSRPSSAFEFTGELTDDTPRHTAGTDARGRTRESTEGDLARDRAKFERRKVASEVASSGFFEEKMPNPRFFRVQIYSLIFSFMRICVRVSLMMYPLKMDTISPIDFQILQYWILPYAQVLRLLTAASSPRRRHSSSTEPRAESREPRAGRKDTELGLTSILNRSRGHERRRDAGMGARMRERTCREHRDEDARLSTRCDASGDARRAMGSMR